MVANCGADWASTPASHAGIGFNFVGWIAVLMRPSFRGDAIASNYDVQLHIGESRDSGSGPSDHPGMTKDGPPSSPHPQHRLARQRQPHQHEGGGGLSAADQNARRRLHLVPLIGLKRPVAAAL